METANPAPSDVRQRLMPSTYLARVANPLPALRTEHGCRRHQVPRRSVQGRCAWPVLVESLCVQDVGLEVSDTSVRWWAVRRAQNRKPATYRCPLCGRHLPALSDHMLIAPEGDTTRRRHAHTECVLNARNAGRLPSRDEWQATQSDKPGFLARVLRRG